MLEVDLRFAELLKGTALFPEHNRWCRFENFLALHEWQEFNSAVIARRTEFVPSTTTTGDTGHRRSRVLYDVPSPYGRMFRARLYAIWPTVASALGLPVFEIRRLVAQITLHAEGDYYRAHRDNNQAGIRRRLVTFVYYVHLEPRMFAGGELALLSAAPRHDEVFQPIGNSILFFFSGILHEVRPVVGGKEIETGRLTVNGWINR